MQLKGSNPAISDHDFERGKKNPDSSWRAKIKFTFTFVMNDGKNSNPMKRTPTFNICKAGENAGKTVWKEQVGA